MTEYKYEKQIGFKFAMPYGRLMEIFRCSNEDFDEDNYEIKIDQWIDGVQYMIKWNGTYLPWSTNTELEAITIAMGCQYGARHILNPIYNSMR